MAVDSGLVSRTRSKGNYEEASGGPAPAKPILQVDRRQFLKLTAVAGVLAYATVSIGNMGIGALSPLSPAAESAGQVSAPSETLYNVVCANNCKQTCRQYAHVYQGKLRMTSLNPMPDPRYNRICLRGLSHAQRVYHPDRLKYPMKRVGNRGSGQWQQITWGEAISTISDQFSRISQQYGSKAVGFIPVSGNYGMVNGMGGAISRFANVFQGTMLGVSTDLAMPLGFQQVGLSYYGGGNEMADIADNARLIIVWGNNVTEADIHSWHFVADAIDNGAKLVVIDPHFSVIASKADTWVNPRPGSDVALGMSMINVIINESLYNQDFLLNHTVAPFLVSAATGLFVREKDFVQGGSDKYVVWDQSSGGPKTYDQSSSPAITGEYTIGSTTVHPAFQLLSDRVASFTPEATQSLTEVSPDVIRTLARDYATRKPASLMPNMGIDRWNNGYLMGRALATLAALTGNVGVSGASPTGEIGGFASLYVSNWNWTVPSGTYAGSLPQALMYDAILNGSVKAFTPADPSNSSLGAGSKEPSDVPYTLKALFSACGNWIGNSPDQKRIVEQIIQPDNPSPDKLEFFVAADVFLNDTTQYADMILPSTHWFENDDLVSGYAHPFLLRSEKALDAPWECKSDYDIFQMLAQNMGLGQYFQGSQADQVAAILSGAQQSLGSGYSAAFDQFNQTGAARFAPTPYVGFSNLQFNTPSGRLEFYGEKELLNYPWALGVPVQIGGDPLVRWEEPMEAWPTNAVAKTYPLQCLQEHTKWRVHSGWFNQPWLREVDPEPVVKMNPTDAAARGIQDGDYVQVYNDRGSAVLKVVFNPGLRPGSVNAPHGWQRSQHLSGGSQELTNSATNPISLNFAYNDVMVEVRKVPSDVQLNKPFPLGQGVNETA